MYLALYILSYDLLNYNFDLRYNLFVITYLCLF